MATPIVLAIAAGSASLKFAMFDAQAGRQPEAICRGSHGPAGECIRLSLSDDTQGGALAGALFEPLPDKLVEAPTHLIDAVERACVRGRFELVAVGHRVVHGGRDYRVPVRVEPIVLVPLAPLHQPANLAPIAEFAVRMPAVSQVACFDTALHTGIPEAARVYGLPRRLAERGLVRFGFHGLACESVMAQLRARDPMLADARVLIVHLGGGASITAARSGRSVHHSMGWSALEGLVMSTRCGAIDPALVLELVRTEGGADRVERMLYRESGCSGFPA
jgi:acetate kinase